MAAKRKSLSKRTRFEIFKRDRFTCQYCGSKPPRVVLWIDHIIPVSHGGDNARLNLVTSCRDCNQGKSNIDLDQVTEIHERAIEEGQEKLAQLKAMQSFVKRERKLQDDALDVVAEAFGLGLNDSEERSIRVFLARLPLDDILQAVDIVTSRRKPFTYFCGICWSKIKGKGW